VYAEPDFYTYLDRVPRGEVGLLDGRIMHQRKSYTLLIQGIRPPELPPWEAAALPTGVRGTEENYRLSRGLYFTLPTLEEALCRVEDLAGITSALHEAGYRGPSLDDPGWWTMFNLEEQPAFLLVMDRARDSHFFMLFSEDEKLVRPLSIVRSLRTESALRIPANLDGLAEKKIGIVGLGSLGSKKGRGNLVKNGWMGKAGSQSTTATLSG
jgi:hypothetical protein